MGHLYRCQGFFLLAGGEQICSWRELDKDPAWCIGQLRQWILSAPPGPSILLRGHGRSGRSSAPVKPAEQGTRRERV